MRILIITLVSLFGLSAVDAQDVKFTVAVSTDSILIGNYFEVTFSIENGDAKNFEAPAFQDFSIVGGPNQSSSLNRTFDSFFDRPFFQEPENRKRTKPKKKRKIYWI